MFLWRFRHHMQSEGGPSAFPVPRKSTSNWAIATCLTRVFSFHPQPQTHLLVSLKQQLQPLFQSKYLIRSRFLFVSVLLWAPRLLYIVWVWNSHLIHHQCSITDLKKKKNRTRLTVFSCHRKFWFFYLEETTNPSYGGLVDWKNWDFWAPENCQ